MFNKVTKLDNPLLLVVAAGLISGCGESRPYDYAAVSGRVTMDGQPLADARVTFFPQRAPDNTTSEGAPEATGMTDTDGHFSLSTVFADEGAAIGRSRVTISTLQQAYDPENPERPARVIAKERVPKRYFIGTAVLEFDVPAGGSEAANFDLTSK